jgi:hypothetical protein
MKGAILNMANKDLTWRSESGRGLAAGSAWETGNGAWLRDRLSRKAHPTTTFHDREESHALATNVRRA